MPYTRPTKHSAHRPLVNSYTANGYRNAPNQYGDVSSTVAELCLSQLGPVELSIRNVV